MLKWWTDILYRDKAIIARDTVELWVSMDIPDHHFPFTQQHSEAPKMSSWQLINLFSSIIWLTSAHYLALKEFRISSILEEPNKNDQLDIFSLPDPGHTAKALNYTLLCLITVSVYSAIWTVGVRGQ